MVVFVPFSAENQRPHSSHRAGRLELSIQGVWDWEEWEWGWVRVRASVWSDGEKGEFSPTAGFSHSTDGRKRAKKH